MPRGSLGFSLAMALLIVFSSPHLAGSKNLKKWRNGPVKYLLSDAERAQWKKLGDDSEREAFVIAFWARRDPSPGTPENEARVEFEKRVKAANHKFRAEGGKGWRTDRGRIYILFGPPDQVTEDATGTIQSGRATFGGGGLGGGGVSTGRSVTRGTVYWTYHRAPDPELPPNAQLVFQADPRGKYVLSTRVDSQWSQFGSTAHLPGSDTETRELALKRTAPMPPAASERPRRKRDNDTASLLRAVLAGEAANDLALLAQPLAFPVGKKQALVLVPFTLELPSDGPTELELVAGVFGDSDKPLKALAMPFTADPGEFDETRSFALSLDPGNYRLALVLRAARDKAPLSSVTATIEVPDFTDGKLHVSSAVFASGIEVQQGRQGKVGEIVDGIALGQFQFEAKPGNRVEGGSTPEIVFLVSGAAADPATGALDITADYRILQGDEQKLELPTQHVQGAITAQPIPLDALAEGVYRLEVKLLDRRSNATYTQAFAFQVE